MAKIKEKGGRGEILAKCRKLLYKTATKILFSLHLRLLTDQDILALFCYMVTRFPLVTVESSSLLCQCVAGVWFAPELFRSFWAFLGQFPIRKDFLHHMWRLTAEGSPGAYNFVRRGVKGRKRVRKELLWVILWRPFACDEYWLRSSAADKSRPR